MTWNLRSLYVLQGFDSNHSPQTIFSPVGVGAGMAIIGRALYDCFCLAIC